MIKLNSINSIKTPVTNRGVVNTLNLKNSLIYQGFENDLNQFILIDWFQCTILDDFTNTGDLRNYAIDLFKSLFGVTNDDLCFEYKGINGYNARVFYKNIYIMYNTFRYDMGINILMSGQGCRDFESLGLDYFQFFRKLKSYDVSYNRIDISIDDFTNRYFNLAKLYKYVRRKSVCSKFLSCININKTKLSDFSNIGNTLQFGSKASSFQVTFYDKLKERESQNFIVSSNIKNWTRTELRFRHERVDEVIDKILLSDSSINTIVKSILREYISFKDIKSKDSNLSRREEASWWVNFLENVDSLKLTNYLPEESITKKIKFVSEQTAMSNLMVFLSRVDNLKTDGLTQGYLSWLFENGIDKFDFNKLKIMNNYRIANGLIPFTMQEISDYLNDLYIVSHLPF